VPAARSRSTAKSRTAPATSPAVQIEQFLSKYTPALATDARRMRSKMQRIVPGGFEFVYDNYNALVFGYGPTERPSEAVLSLALMPRWVTLCFLNGKGLSDPGGLLQGGGNKVRHVRLQAPVSLEDPPIADLIQQAIRQATPQFGAESARPRTVIKSISAKQRPRRPVEPRPKRAK